MAKRTVCTGWLVGLIYAMVGWLDRCRHQLDGWIAVRNDWTVGLEFPLLGLLSGWQQVGLQGNVAPVQPREPRGAAMLQPGMCSCCAECSAHMLHWSGACVSRQQGLIARSTGSIKGERGPAARHLRRWPAAPEHARRPRGPHHHHHPPPGLPFQSS